MRLVFAGTPDFAATALRALLASGHQIVGVYSQPDRPSGRGRKLIPSPVKQVAIEWSLPVFQPESLKAKEAQAELKALDPELIVVAAYGLILPRAVLDIPPGGCLNIHASLLPRWRGAAPIQRAIAAGDSESGITIMQMAEGLDTGDMLYKSTTSIESNDTGGSLHDRLAEMGGVAIVEALKRLEAGILTPEPQDDEQACYAHKLTKHDGHIDWTWAALEIDRQIRAFNPYPGSYSDLDQDRIRIHQARVLPATDGQRPGTVLARAPTGIDIACGDGTLRIERLQLAGSRPQSAADLINGGKPLLLPGQGLH
ncbi:MAG: methionyl-tRNA formyltransferase [Marinobacter sp.]|uniref:methionyl-tRNA formyltransferase n=1 Tax=Marinobacter sp. TaxID=50741 RepID=UPI0034A0A93E